MPCLEGPPECALDGTILLRCVRCRRLLSDPEVVAVLHERMVRALCSVATSEGSWNSHASDGALNDGENGGRTLIAGAVRALEAAGGVHEHDDVPRSPERCRKRARDVDVDKLVCAPPCAVAAATSLPLMCLQELMSLILRWLLSSEHLRCSYRGLALWYSKPYWGSCCRQAS